MSILVTGNCVSQPPPPPPLSAVLASAFRCRECGEELPQSEWHSAARICEPCRVWCGVPDHVKASWCDRGWLTEKAP